MMAERKRLGERLVEAGFLSTEHLDTALEYQNEHGGLIGDVLVQQGYVTEVAMLRFLAAEYNTRYVSTDKLAKVKIPSAILERVPVRMAEAKMVLPILWDDSRKVLSVVMATPQDTELQIELQLVSESASVQAYIATRSAIAAAVKKHYYGDINAFADLEAMRPQSRRDVKQLAAYYDEQGGKSISELTVPTETAPGVETGSIAPTSVRQAVDAVQSASLTTDNDFVETLNVLVGLIEMPRERFKGHSAAVAKLALQICRRMNLGQRETNHVVMAAYLHDLGKKEDLHLTLPTISETDLLRREAKRYYRTPLRLMEAVRLPNAVNEILGRLYEAWDGSGVPEGIAGASIPLGARIIAAIDAFEDFIRVPRDGAEVLDRDAALREVQAYAGTVLDPQVVELLRETLTGDLMRRRLLAQGRHILLVDPDPENASLLELKLSQRGYVVSLARDYDAALEIAEDGTDLIISEVQLPDRDGFTLLETLREKPWGRTVPFVFLTADDDSTSVEKGLRLGAADYVIKPYAAVVFLAKIKRILEAYGDSEAKRKSIRGTLDEIKLEDIVSILGDAGRSGQIKVESKNRDGEIFLDKGRVVNAVFESIRGEEAFTGILTIKKGRFTFNPQVEVLERQMDEKAEELLGRARARIAGSSSSK